jgi:hypothetical protein
MIRSFLVALSLFGVTAASLAAEVSPEDAVAIRAVINEQLEAFAHDDAQRAFSLATSGIRAQFGTPEIFLEMVRSSYPVVYRPKSVQFEKPVFAHGEIIQPVRMSDAAGQGWMALYPMRREADNAWRINGCYLERLSGRQVQTQIGPLHIRGSNTPPII